MDISETLDSRVKNPIKETMTLINGQDCRDR